jgi:hypothetical protein
MLGSASIIGTRAVAEPTSVRSSKSDTRDTAREVLLAFLNWKYSAPSRHLRSMLEPMDGKRANVISTPQQNASIMSCWPCHPPLSRTTKLNDPSG